VKIREKIADNLKIVKESLVKNGYNKEKVFFSTEECYSSFWRWQSGRSCNY
jgi:hypothetical protein